VLAACVAAMLSAGALAQSGPVPPGAVGMGAAPANPEADPVVAEVEGRAVHLAEVGDEIRSLPGGGAGNALEALYPMALQRVIEREALVVRAHADGVGADPSVHRQIQEASDKLLVEAYVRRATSKLVTAEMLSARYDTEIKGKPGPEEVHAQVILVPTEAGAQDIIAKLAAGGDFAALARESSRDRSSIAGGDLGFVQRDAVSPELGAVLFSLRPGEFTPYPVRTQAGWFVLRTVARQAGPTPSFAEVHDRLQAESERDHVAAVVKAALSGMTIRAYDMTGH
jgi:peptidyl-prolyl cis-trans isomerase C